MTKQETTRHPQWDEIEYHWQRTLDEFHAELQELGVDWIQPTLGEEEAKLREHIHGCAPTSGLSKLSNEEMERLSCWIETRIHDEVWLVIRASRGQWDRVEDCLKLRQAIFHTRIEELGIDWIRPNLGKGDARSRERIQKISRLSGLSGLADAEVELVSCWIEVRIHQEIRLVIKACLKRFPL